MNLPNSLGFPSTQFLDGWFEGWKPNDAGFIGKTILPEEAHAYPSVEWDEVDGVAGMTPAHALGAPVPTLAQRARRKRIELPFYFGEKQELGEEDFLHIRALGTFNEFAGRELVLQGQEQILIRQMVRQEWSRWQAMQGSLTIAVNGVNRTVTYGVTAISSPSTSWATVASANPIANLQAWNLLFRGLGDGMLECYYNSKMSTYLAQNAIVRDLIKANSMSELVASTNIGNALTKIVGNVKFIEYDGGAMAEDGVTYMPFIPDNKIILRKPPPAGQKFGSWKTTPSVKNGGPFSPKPGRFNWTKDKTGDTDCPRYIYGGGIYGIPVLNFAANCAPVTVVF